MIVKYTGNEYVGERDQANNLDLNAYNWKKLFISSELTGKYRITNNNVYNIKYAFLVTIIKIFFDSQSTR